MCAYMCARTGDVRLEPMGGGSSGVCIAASNLKTPSLNAGAALLNNAPEKNPHDRYFEADIRSGQSSGFHLGEHAEADL